MQIQQLQFFSYLNCHFVVITLCPQPTSSVMQFIFHLLERGSKPLGILNIALSESPQTQLIHQSFIVNKDKDID